MVSLFIVQHIWIEINNWWTQRILEWSKDFDYWWVFFSLNEWSKNLDKKLRLLWQRDMVFGGVNVIFAGDFYQLLPVGGGKPLYDCND